MNLKNDLLKLKEILYKSKAMKSSEVFKVLDWSPKKKKENNEIIEEWIRNGELIRNKKDKITTPESLGLIKGNLNIIKDRFAFVDTEEEGIFIPRSAFNSALDGDTVFVNIVKEKSEDRGREGEVYKVISRAKDLIVGILEKRDNFGFVVPTHSFGKDIFIHGRNMMKAKDKDLVVVKITFWGDEEKKPEGEIIEIIGDPFNTKNMIDALIIREKLSDKFSNEVLNEVKNIDKSITKEEISKRKDLRDLNIITIDGIDAKDLDDAVYVEKLENDNYRLIVSIADVSHYVKENSLLDKEAEKRGNSIYLVDRVIPMFPKEISNGICSLNAREDKFTFTCDMEIDKKGKVLKSDTYKSVINTVHRMTYEDVNKIIDGDKELKSKYLDILPMIENMIELSQIIRAKKHKRGSIDFDLPEYKLILDKDQKVEYVKPLERGESEKIIEDFMIEANETVASKIFWLDIPSVYRTHEKPDVDKMKILNETLSKFKYRIHDLEDVHPKQFQSIIENSKEKGVNLIIHKMILMALKQARYTLENSGHFGLASKCYTHFTSPIRRYADLMIHRILNSILNGYPNAKVNEANLKKIPSVCIHISKTERDAMKLEEESKKIKLVEYMMNKVGEEFEATVIGMSNRRVFFETSNYVECSWDVVGAKDYYIFDEQEYMMVNSNNNEEVYKLGDKLKITLVRASLIDLEIEVVPSHILNGESYFGGKNDTSKQ